MTFTTAANGGRTIMGNSSEECAKALADAGAAAAGTNCGDLVPLDMAKVVAVMRASTALPLLAQPNAGLPELKNGKTVFNLSPDDFARGISECIKAGAKIVGGCCGTTSEHIEAVKKILP